MREHVAYFGELVFVIDNGNDSEFIPTDIKNRVWVGEVGAGEGFAQFGKIAGAGFAKQVVLTCQGLFGFAVFRPELA